VRRGRCAEFNLLYDRATHIDIRADGSVEGSG
jgi:coproporphyrinogen III oxidase